MSGAFSSNSHVSFVLEVDMSNVAFQTEFAHSPDLDLFFLSTKSLQHLHFDALPRTGFLVRDHMSALSHGFTSLAGTCCELPLAAACW